MQYDIKPTRRFHSVMLIHDSIAREAFSISSNHYTGVILRAPDSCESTAACCAHLYRELIPLLVRAPP